MIIRPNYIIAIAFVSLFASLAPLGAQNIDYVSCSGSNDQAAVQAVINNSQPGDTVEFGGGQSCVVAANGNAPGLLFLGGRTYHGTGTQIRLSSSTAGFPLVASPNGNSDNLTIDGLILDANNLGVAVMHIATVYYAGSSLTQNVTVKNSIFRNAAGALPAPNGAGIYSSVPILNASFSNNQFLNVAHGIMLSGGTNLTISTNTFNTITSGDAIYIPIYGPQNNIRVINNSARQLYRMGIEIQARSEGFSVDDVLVQGNDFEDWMTTPDQNSSMGISIVLNGRNVRVLNNTLKNGGISFGIEAGNPGLLVDSNVVSGFPLGIGVSGIGITISNNTLTAQTDTAVQLTNAAENLNTQIINNQIINPKNAGIACVQGNHAGSLFKNNSISRQGGYFPDDSGITFRAIITPGGLNGPLTIQGNTIIQSATNPPGGFQFWGVGLYGLYPGSVLDSNQISSASSQQLGIGLVLPYAPTLNQSSVTNNTFTNLAYVSNGPTSANITAQNNVACNVGQSDPFLITSNNCPSSVSPPVVSIISPAQNQTVSGTVTVQASAVASAGLSGVQFEVDGSLLGSAVSAAPLQATLDTTTLPNGIHMLSAVVYDLAGGSATASSVPVTVSNVSTVPAAPIVGFVSPSSNQSVAGPVTVNVTATSAATIASVSLQIDGANYGSQLNAVPYTWTFDSISLANGNHTLNATAVDQFGQTTTATLTIVVANQVTPTPTVCPGPATNAFTGCYYSDLPYFFQALDIVRTDPVINFNWSQNSPDPAVPQTFFSVKWTGNFTFNSGTYTFTATADDGVRVWVDGQLIIDYWDDESATTRTGLISLTAGTHLVEMDYFQSGGAAIAQLSWTQ